MERRGRREGGKRSEGQVEEGTSKRGVIQGRRFSLPVVDARRQEKTAALDHSAR